MAARQYRLWSRGSWLRAGQSASVAGRCSLRERQAHPRLGRWCGMQALVVIGDELLSGAVEDCNGRFLCRELHALGWRTSRVGCPLPPAPMCQRLGVRSWLHLSSPGVTGAVCCSPGVMCLKAERAS